MVYLTIIVIIIMNILLPCKIDVSTAIAVVINCRTCVGLEKGEKCRFDNNV